MSESTKTYLIHHKDGSKRRITVPESWKVTFGPATRGNRDKHSNLKMPMALRFYESDAKQRAIFTDVVSFRDTSIKIEELKEEVQEKDGYMECDGVKKRTTFQAKVRTWVNPDEESDELPKLPDDTSMFDL
jgi:hypothetical protein